MSVRLSKGGIDFVLEAVSGALVIRYWGPTVDGGIEGIPFERTIPNSDFDEMQNPGVLREHSRGWLGYPTLSGHRNGINWSTQFVLDSLKDNNGIAKAILEDRNAKLRIEYTFELDECGILKACSSITNLGTPYTLNEFFYWLPIPERASQSLDFAGRWSKERNPQRRDIAIGRWVRDSHEGRSGHNFTIGEIALTPQTNFGSGEAWAVALAWSSDTQYCIEKNYENQISIGASQILRPGEVILDTDEVYHAPELLATYSEEGLDGLANNFHRYVRKRSNHPHRPRPLTLNLWEAIYFNHDETKINALVDLASELGIERVVLDDGWFGSRRNDRSGLGDWAVSTQVWPQGLKKISDRIHSKGMEFGLWFEGEMVNPDSDLFRNHPDWILSDGARTPPLWRHELVLDLTKAEVFNYVLESVSKVIAENGIDYIKWDHNRVLVDAGSRGRPAYTAQTLAIYALFDELKRRHSGLEIESCASGGARIDLGMVNHVDRFWTSDNNDALERQTIQRWTMQFIPPELLGTHIGPSPSHQTGRALSLTFRAITALFGHAGIEWDISSISKDERTQLKAWIAYYKSKRSLLHSAEMVRIDNGSENYLYGVVSIDKRDAIFAYAQLQPEVTSHPAKIVLRGLDGSKKYSVIAVTDFGAPALMAITPSPWLENAVVASGDALMKVGLPAPILRPESAFLIEVRAL